MGRFFRRLAPTMAGSEAETSSRSLRGAAWLTTFQPTRFTPRSGLIIGGVRTLGALSVRERPGIEGTLCCIAAGSETNGGSCPTNFRFLTYAARSFGGSTKPRQR